MEDTRWRLLLLLPILLTSFTSLATASSSPLTSNPLKNLTSGALQSHQPPPSIFSEDSKSRVKRQEGGGSSPISSNTTAVAKGSDITGKKKVPSSSFVLKNITRVNLRAKCNATHICYGDHFECRSGICKCAPGYLPRMDDGDKCGDALSFVVETPRADPTMIAVLIGLTLMSVTLCIVLRLFAKARFRGAERSIFNRPNARLMNVSLIQTKKQKLKPRRNSTAEANTSLSHFRRGSNETTEEFPPGGGAATENGGDPDGVAQTQVTTINSSRQHSIEDNPTPPPPGPNPPHPPPSSNPSNLPPQRSSRATKNLRQDSVASNV